MFKFIIVLYFNSVSLKIVWRGPVYNQSWSCYGVSWLSTSKKENHLFVLWYWVTYYSTDLIINDLISIAYVTDLISGLDTYLFLNLAVGQPSNNMDLSEIEIYLGMMIIFFLFQ